MYTTNSKATNKRKTGLIKPTNEMEYLKYYLNPKKTEDGERKQKIRWYKYKRADRYLK